ncbi:Chaperonin GroEL [Dirofilaria immitis]
MELFKRVIDDNLRMKNIGINVVQNISSIYSEKFGFNKRTTWMIDMIEVKNVDKTKIIVDDNDEDVHLTVKDGKEVCLQRIIDYDAKIAKCQRDDFVGQWAIDRIDAVCKILVNSNNEIIGYGCGRLLSIVGCPSFGPIYCNSDDGFKHLFHALYSCFDEELDKQNLIILYIPTIKFNIMQQILHHATASFQLKEQFIPQFTQEIPDHNIDKIYCLPDVTMFI